MPGRIHYPNSILIFLMLVSCERYHEASSLDYDFASFNCEALQETDVKKACKDTESYKKSNRTTTEEALKQQDIRVWEYSKDYYQSLPNEFLGKNSFSYFLSKATQTRIVLSGDLHGEPGFADMHIHILKALIENMGANRLICASEMDELTQISIDAFTAGSLTERELREKIESYTAQEWQDWVGYFRFCRQHAIPFFAVDINQDSLHNFSLSARDRHIARNITHLAQRFPDRTIFAPYGTFHIAGKGRLPELLNQQSLATFRFIGLINDAFHWRCADKVGSERSTMSEPCIVDENSAYMFPGKSLYATVKRLWDAAREE